MIILLIKRYCSRASRYLYKPPLRQKHQNMNPKPVKTLVISFVALIAVGASIGLYVAFSDSSESKAIGSEKTISSDSITIEASSNSEDSDLPIPVTLPVFTNKIVTIGHDRISNAVDAMVLFFYRSAHYRVALKSYIAAGLQPGDTEENYKYASYLTALFDEMDKIEDRKEVDFSSKALEKVRGRILIRIRPENMFTHYSSRPSFNAPALAFEETTREGTIQKQHLLSLPFPDENKSFVIKDLLDVHYKDGLKLSKLPEYFVIRVSPNREKISVIKDLDADNFDKIDFTSYLRISASAKYELFGFVFNAHAHNTGFKRSDGSWIRLIGSFVETAERESVAESMDYGYIFMYKKRKE